MIPRVVLNLARQLTWCWLLGPSLVWAAERPTVVLEGQARVVVDLRGGSIAEFRLRDSSLNPLKWGVPSRQDPENRGFGHFLCLDRWGPPSDAEGARGVPYHGEAAHVAWEITQPLEKSATQAQVEVSAQLPLAGLSIRRQLRMALAQPVCRVEEQVTNNRPLGRIYNQVQHPTIAPPFLDPTTLVDCNGRRGFAQGNPLPHPEEPSFFWPAALNRDGIAVNLRRLTTNPDPNVVSYAIDETLGWVTAVTPGRGLLIGYLWKTTDYPWVSLWRDVRDGAPVARGLEFGTTGLHQPFSVLTQVGRIWERPLFAYLDAGETQTRVYTMFLAEVPLDFEGVERISLNGTTLTLHERRVNSPRQLKIEAGREFWP
ncbi:MAG: hypothetical protein J0M24_24845 [Verrucomicrobia bacterium]|nr:hypothetical protein [Verrucomicrobiota bacterium]